MTVRAKQLRAPGQQQPTAPITGPPPHEIEAPGAYTDFRTLAKGLPDPPQVSPLTHIERFLKMSSLLGNPSGAWSSGWYFVSYMAARF